MTVMAPSPSTRNARYFFHGIDDAPASDVPRAIVMALDALAREGGIRETASGRDGRLAESQPAAALAVELSTVGASRIDIRMRSISVEGEPELCRWFL